MPSSTGGAAITKLTTPPAMETICAWRALFADNKRIMYVFQGIPPSVYKIEITTLYKNVTIQTNDKNKIQLIAIVDIQLRT